MKNYKIVEPLRPLRPEVPSRAENNVHSSFGLPPEATSPSAEKPRDFCEGLKCLYPAFFYCAVFFMGLIINPQIAYGWGASTPRYGTHQFIDEEAYKCLKQDPAFVPGTFPTLEQLLVNEGNTLLSGGQGLGPDAQGKSPYSWHYYNPRLSTGGAPQAVENFSKNFVISLKKDTKAGAWSVHFVADMFTPVHINGVMIENIKTIYNEQTNNGTNDAAVFLSEEITGPEGAPNRNWRVEIERFFAKAKDDSMVNFSDPWYWDSMASYLNSTHCQWERANPKHENNSKCAYDPNWKNPQLSFHSPEDVHAESAKEFTILAAWETNRNILLWKNKNPQIALGRAIQAVYTLWRASFSALKPTIEFSSVDRGGKRIYEITGTVLNLADESAKGVQAKLTVWDGENIKFRGEQNIGEVKGNRGTQKTPQVWKLEVEAPDSNNPAAQKPKLKLELEVVGSFAKTPDYQYAVVEKEIEVEPAKLQRKIVILAAEVKTKEGKSEGKVGEKFFLKIVYYLDGILTDEKVEVKSNLVVKGPATLPFSEQKDIVDGSKSFLGMGESKIEANVVLAKPGSYAWHYKIEADNFIPGEGEVPFYVTETARAPVTPVTPDVQPPLVKANYVYVLDYTSYGGGAGAEGGGISPTENTVPLPKKRSGKVTGSQTSFAFGMYGVFGDYSYSGEANVKGQLTISGLPQSVKPGEKLNVTATVSGGGTWQRKGKSSLPVYFRLNGEENLTLTKTVIVPDDGREEYEPVTFSGSGTVPEFFRDSCSISVTPHYRRFESGKVPADVRPKDLDTYPEKLPPEFEASMNKFIEEAAAKAKQEETQVTQPSEDPTAKTAAAILSSPLPWTNPRVQEIINSWLKIARPVIQQEQGGNWFYDEWGRAYNNTSIKKPTQKPDTTLDRYQYLWNISGQLNSVSHLTLREYIEKTLRGEAIIAKPKPPVLVPQPPPGTPTGSKIGQAAPVFETTDINGRPFNLTKERSNAVVLLFWASWDLSSRNVSSSLQGLANQYSGERLRVVGINSAESSERIKSFVAETGLNYTQVLDMQQRIAQLYNLEGYPQIFVIDPRGVIKFVGTGSNVADSSNFQNAVKSAVEESRQYRTR